VRNLIGECRTRQPDPRLRPTRRCSRQNRTKVSQLAPGSLGRTLGDDKWAPILPGLPANYPQDFYNTAISRPLRTRYVLGNPQAARLRRKRASVQELDRSSLQPFLTLTDLHTYTLTFGQLIQSAAAERGRVDENILSAAILRYETKSLLDVVPFN
jgi:hypothetical protein